MSRDEEKAQQWQFGIRKLLFVTALAAIIAWFYRSNLFLGYFLTVIMMALWGGGLLRRGSFDGEAQRNYGIFASTGVGAFAGAFQLAILSAWQAMSNSAVLNLWDFVLGGCIFGAFFGGIVGFIVWLSWVIVVVCFQSFSEFVARLR